MISEKIPCLFPLDNLQNNYNVQQEVERCLTDYDYSKGFYTDNKLAIFEIFKIACQKQNEALCKFCLEHFSLKTFNSGDFELLLKFAAFFSSVNMPQEEQEFHECIGDVYPKDHDTAVGVLQKVISEYPTYAYARTLLAIAWYNLKNWDEAVASAQIAIEIGPQIAKNYRVLGCALCRKKDYQSAEKALLGCISLDSTDRKAYGVLSNVYKALGCPDEARVALMQARAIEPEDSITVSSQIDTTAVATTTKTNHASPELSEEAARCLQEYRKWEQFRTADKSVVIQLFWLAYRIKDKELLGFCKGHLLDMKWGPVDFESIVESVDCFLVLEDKEHAKIFKEMIDTHCPEDSSKAKRALHNIIQRKPNCGSAYTALSMILISENALEEAENAILHAIQSGFDRTVNVLLLGGIQMCQDRLEEAIGVVQQLIMEEPTNTVAFDLLIAMQELQGISDEQERHDAALKAFKHIYKGESEENGEVDEIEQQLKAAIEENPNDSLSYEILGDLLREKKRFEEAARYMQQAIQLDKQNPSLPIKLCTILYEQGSYDKVKIVLEDSIRLHGSTEEALELRKKLGKTAS
ncbi:MAG: tetratricopeptide repeat protein [Verrucomicrobia bacterium]|nr:tetratricopeptide repeat protein [Verrucomicrobiota bacterium]